MRRFGFISKIKPGMLNKYKELHDGIWDDVVKAAHMHNLRNYTIFHKDGLLFSYFEYVGTDFEGDIKKKNILPAVKKWQQACGECLQVDDVCANSNPETLLDEIFHHKF